MPCRTDEATRRFDTLEERIGAEFKDRNLLLEAVTHRSFLNEHPDHPLDHNERLEFVGDAVLELVVTEFLFRSSKEQEGVLTNQRAALVNIDSLAAVGKELGLNEIILMSRGEQASKNTRAADIIIGNAVEAILGALYLDQGIGACRIFIDHYLLSRRRAIVEAFRDPKSQLQELTQAAFGLTPVYSVVDERGPDHDKWFKLEVKIGERRLGTGEGPNKRAAQAAAAENALANLKTEGLPSERQKMSSNGRLSEKART